MSSHHEAAQDNVRSVITGINHINEQPMTAVQAQGAYTAQLAIATIANTQALLAINETLNLIATRSTP